ncbi:MAG: GGDEF domain-containing protein [Ruminococcus sp.]|nr:GGDEF domain-containing protein [Ruminococcus sp.]
MANTKEKSINHSRPYIFAAILLAVVYILNAILVDTIYRKNNEVTKQTSSAMSSCNRINFGLQAVNGSVLRIIGEVGDPTENVIDVQRNFGSIRAAMADFEDIEGLSDTAKKRYAEVAKIVTYYNERLLQLQGLYNQKDEETQQVKGMDAFKFGPKALYTQDIYPLQATANEMITALISIVNKDTAETMKKNTILSYVLMSMMLLIAILGEIAIFIIAKMAKKSRLELEAREKSLAEVDAKLKSTRQKASDLAVMNVLTGMKNRYALDNDVTDRLESDRFNIAVFDMDNFRSINDTYGYDFGDEYLAAVAERLKEEFGSVAEIYNITGNEFCFLFNKEISESQAMGIIQNIQSVITAPYEVLNLAVQLPCSGAVYHYLPGDCLNVNSLLVKLDTAMRNAKMNGGNMINTVVNI